MNGNSIACGGRKVCGAPWRSGHPAGFSGPVISFTIGDLNIPLSERGAPKRCCKNLMMLQCREAHHASKEVREDRIMFIFKQRYRKCKKWKMEKNLTVKRSKAFGCRRVKRCASARLEYHSRARRTSCEVKQPIGRKTITTIAHC
jgi:hypothetical protein